MRDNAGTVSQHRDGQGTINAYIEAPEVAGYNQYFTAEVVYSCAGNYSFAWRISYDGGMTYSSVVSTSDQYTTAIQDAEQGGLVLLCEVSSSGGSTVVYRTVGLSGGSGGSPRLAARTISEPDAYLLSASPNPAQQDMTVSFALPEAQTGQLSLIDQRGVVVQTAPDEVFAAGSHTRVLRLGQMPAGLYVVRLATPGRVLSQKIVVVH